MSKSANRRVFRRRTDVDQTPVEPKRRWWRRRSQDTNQGETSTLSPVSVNHPGATGLRVVGDPSKRQRLQRRRLREQRANGNSVREWLQQQLVANEKRRDQRRKDAKDRTGVSRGVDRVPDRLRVGRTKPVPDPAPVETRLVRGRWVQAPYRNPDRIHRLAKSGRLRAELRDQADAGETGAQA